MKLQKIVQDTKHVKTPQKIDHLELTQLFGQVKYRKQLGLQNWAGMWKNV